MRYRDDVQVAAGVQTQRLPEFAVTGQSRGLLSITRLNYSYGLILFRFIGLVNYHPAD